MSGSRNMDEIQKRQKKLMCTFLSTLDSGVRHIPSILMIRSRFIAMKSQSTKAHMSMFHLAFACVLGLLFSCHLSWAQCPGQDQVDSITNDLSLFETSKGELTYIIGGQQKFQRESYRIRLWEEKTQKYIYDDNAPSFLNIPQLAINGQEIVFSELPEGHYTLELHNDECQYQKYGTVRASTDQAN